MRSATRDPATPPAVALIGAAGRLGRAVDSELGSRGLKVVLRAGRSAWTPDETPTVVFDASSPDCFERTVELCTRERAALVYAVSAIPDEHQKRLDRLALEVPVVRAVNLSPGHWLQVSLIEAAARLAEVLPEPAVATVAERHPLTKADRPSASAADLADVWRHAGGRAVADIASIRAGHPVSDHEIRLDFGRESLIIQHLVTDLRAAAAGAAAVLHWAHRAEPGLYTIRQVFDELFQERIRAL